MSLWSDIGSAIVDFVSGDSVSSIIPSVIEAGATIAGTVISSNANKEAARLANQGAEAQAAAVREGNRVAQARYDELMETAAPSQSHLRTIVAADPYALTPAQQIDMADVNRRVTENLNASGLRGSGRAQAAAFRAIEGDVRGGIIESNLARKDAAARTLSGQYVSAVGDSARLDTSSGRATGTSLRDVGATQAGLETSNAALTGEALGDITSLISSDLKNRRRESKYENFREELTRA